MPTGRDRANLNINEMPMDRYSPRLSFRFPQWWSVRPDYALDLGTGMRLRRLFVRGKEKRDPANEKYLYRTSVIRIWDYPAGPCRNS